MHIYHLAEPEDWFEDATSYRAPSLESEGFIHCSTESQLHDVAERFYPGREDLWLLAVDPDLIDVEVVYEDLYQSGELFPHVYGPIPRRAVLKAERYRPI